MVTPAGAGARIIPHPIRAGQTVVDEMSDRSPDLATAPWTDAWPTGRYQLRLWHPLVPEWTEVLDDPGPDLALRVTLDVGR